MNSPSASEVIRKFPAGARARTSHSSFHGVQAVENSLEIPHRDVASLNPNEPGKHRMGQRTTLHDWHAAHGARMVDFAGWDMPVQYTTIIDEHRAVRNEAGLFDISHMGRLSFEGPDALALIQKVYTNNAATMKDGQVRYGLVCNDHGGIRDDVLVYRWPYGYAMVVNASNRPKIVDWLSESKDAFNVEVQDQTLSTCMI